MKNLVLIAGAILTTLFSQAQWEPDVRLTNDQGNSSTSYSSGQNIAASGETVHFVWEDDREGDFSLYYKRSTDGGITWGTDTRLVNSPSLSQKPHIAVSGDSVHVVWYDDRDIDLEIYYKRSVDGGLTWGEDIRLTNRASPSKYPSIAVSGSMIHIAWIDSDPWNVFYKQSFDGGDTWEEDAQLTNTPWSSWHPCLAVSGSLLHLVYYDYHDGWWEIFYKRSIDEGLTWEADVRLTDDIGGSYNPSLCSAGQDVHVAWYDSRDGGREIYYKRSTDGGITWGEDIRLTNAPGISRYPSIVAAGSKVYMVWHDDRDGYDPEIYYQHSEDAGLSWNAADTALTKSYWNSLFPSIALAGSTVHVVWTDFRDGNDEIYYKRNPTGSGAILSVTPANQNVTAVVGTTAFTVTSNRDWSAQSDATWCTVTSSGSGNGEILAEYTENISSQPRIATINVKVDTLLERIVTLSQKSIIGIEYLSERAVRIYPNPASSIIHIHFNDNPSARALLTVHNILGEIVIRKQIQTDESFVDVSTLPNGIYFVEIEIPGKQTESRKLMIQK